MKKKPIEVKSRGLTVKIFVTHAAKKEKVYATYQVADYSSGKRKLWSFSDESKARKKALEICEANAQGQALGDADLARLYLEKRTIQNAFEEAERVGLRIGEAIRLVRQAMEIIPHEELLDACRFWKARRPDKPFTPKTVSETTREHMACQGRLSARRRQTLTSYFGQLQKKFGERLLHQITEVDLKDFVDGKKWSPATFNSVLNSYSLLYRHAQVRSQVPPGYNPIIGIKRLKVLAGQIGILGASEVRTILTSVNEALIPFLTVWFFAGARKDEISRLDWQQIRMALKSGVLEIERDQALKTGARSVRLLPNLRAWLEWFLRRHPDASGPLLPLQYNGERRLDNVQRTIARQSGIKWVRNGGRHSFVTHRCKLADVTSVADECGTSPLKIERNYRRKGVTLESALDYFAIMPPTDPANIVPMSQPEATGVQRSAAPAAG